MEYAKIQGDKLETSRPTESMISKLELEKRPIDADLEKKQGDPLFDAAKFKEVEEVHPTAKLARELPEYHQGEARLKPHGVLETEVHPTEVLSAQAVLMAENAKELAQESKEFIKEKAAEGYVAAMDATQTAAHIAQEKAVESKEFVQEKAHEVLESASKQADTLLDKAYQGEQYLVEKAVDAEVYLVEKAVDAEAYLEEKGKQAKAKATDLLVNTIAPAVGYAIGSAYVALTHATGFVVEKSREEIEYLEKEAEVLGTEMVSEAKHLKDEAIVLGSEIAKDAAEKTKDGLAVASELGKETLVVAAEKTNHTMEYLAEKGHQTVEYLEKEAEILSHEGAEFIALQKQQIASQMEKIAEDAKHNPDAASLLRELADETEIKAPLPAVMSRSANAGNADDFMKQDFDRLSKLKKEHDLAAKQAAQRANFLQHEKQFEQVIAQKLTDSLRLSHVEAEERALEEGGYDAVDDENLGTYQRLDSPMPSPAIEVTKGELKPLLHHHAQFTEPASPLTI
eukprot:TRINITY_DN1323_c0_g1_i1.p1 TRINITY_DN1323_c0_g1~~TRINITY_DN1323_c0_g1_i1.p1  ORF type:complete len:512 (+),score=195.37 TRINITY_DN1323_c0_g1_i1:72-1607(+)